MEQISQQEIIIPSERIKRIKTLGQGSFGLVYQGKLDQSADVAVKEFILTELTERIKEEFQNETQIMIKMRHPNVIMMYGYCLSPPILVMELMEGSLFNLLQSKGDMAWDLRFQLALDIASGLQYIHNLGILHRDLKSLNILIDSKKRAKISDFGFSRVKLTTQSLKSVQKAGTYQWLAPELLSLQPKFSTQSDIYALGMVI